MGENFRPVFLAGAYDADGKLLKKWSELTKGYLEVTNNTDGTKTLRGIRYKSGDFYLHKLNTLEGAVKIVVEDGITRLETKQYKPLGLSYRDYGTFSGCENLETVVLPESVVRLQTEAFYGCKNLKKINIPHDIQYIGTDAFRGCSLLTASVVLSSENTYIGSGAFQSCGNIELIDLSLSRASSFGERTFSGCRKARFKFADDIVYYLYDYVFSYCEKLDSLPKRIRGIQQEAFSYCIGLVDVYIPKETTYIGTNIFKGCANISSIVVDPENTKFDSRDNCNAIIQTENNSLRVACKNTVIPNSVEKIGSYAFGACTDLTEITIPDSITEINTYAFTGCTNLTTIHYSGPATGAPWGATNATVVP